MTGKFTADAYQHGENRVREAMFALSDALEDPAVQDVLLRPEREKLESARDALKFLGQQLRVVTALSPAAEPLGYIIVAVDEDEVVFEDLEPVTIKGYNDDAPDCEQCGASNAGSRTSPHLCEVCRPRPTELGPGDVLADAAEFADVPFDDTPYGRGGDYCPWCGADWKAPHRADCERPHEYQGESLAGMPCYVCGQPYSDARHAHGLED